MRHPAVTVLTLLALSACTIQPRAPTTQVTDWQRFVDRQQRLTRWHMEAKLGYQAPQDSGSALVVWQQNQRHFDVHLSGPFGSYATRISGEPNRVVMRRGDEQRLATSSEALTEQLLGLPLPVETLTYWVRGIPAPAIPIAGRTHNAAGALATLSQAGWDLEFSRYNETDGWLLPGKIAGRRGNLSFKLIVKRWLSVSQEENHPAPNAQLQRP